MAIGLLKEAVSAYEQHMCHAGKTIARALHRAATHAAMRDWSGGKEMRGVTCSDTLPSIDVDFCQSWQCTGSHAMSGAS